MEIRALLPIIIQVLRDHWNSLRELNCLSTQSEATFRDIKSIIQIAISLNQELYLEK